MSDLNTERGFWTSEALASTHTVDLQLSEAIIEAFPGVKNAIDIGCGNGGYTKNFIKHGIKAVGYDGNPYTRQVSGGLCGTKDFSEPVDLGKFDLVLSLEVGEHIPAKYEQVFIDNLARHAEKHICLSWAVEGQAGYGHFNCRNNDYVIEEFRKRGFAYDPEISQRLRDASNQKLYPWFANTVMSFRRVEKKSILSIFAGMESQLVTVVITSCGRLNLLKRTVSSFLEFNTFPVHEIIIVEDSGDKNIIKQVRREYLGRCSLIIHDKPMGQINSIDDAYSEISTPYIFHAENDWQFYRSGFMEKSLEILLLQPEIMQVWLRELNDTNGHPIEENIYKAGETEYRLVATNVNGWHGGSFNPGLRRLSDYKKIAPYSKIGKQHAQIGHCEAYREMLIGQEYYKLGYRAAILLNGYVKHIG